MKGSEVMPPLLRRRSVLTLCGAVALSSIGWLITQQKHTTVASAQAQSAIAFTHVTVIDGTGAAPRTDMVVVVTGDRISAVAKVGDVRVPEGTQIVDATGKFLIPGLWNMHVHSVSYEEGEKAFPEVLAWGITGVRDMGAAKEDVLRLRTETVEGTLLGPRMVVAGPLLQGPLPPSLAKLPLLQAVSSEKEAKEVVSSLKQTGVDFIKVQDSLPREIYFAIASEAARQQIPFAGHIPPAISAWEASTAGQKSIEHLGGTHYGVLVACADSESQLHAEVRGIMQSEVEAAFQGRDPDNSRLFRAAFTKRLLQAYSERKAVTLFRLFVKNNTWQVPTLVALQGLWRRDDLSEEDNRYGKRIRLKEFEIVNGMRKAHVRVMAGTDGPMAHAAQNLHDELALLVEAGFTPMEALQTATRNPAEFLGLSHSLGTIQKGKLADLVLLDANPLESILNTRKIRAVVVIGRYLNRDTLDGMLPHAATTPAREN